MVRTATHFDLAEQLERLADQIRAYGAYKDEAAKQQAWGQIQARAQKISEMGGGVSIGVNGVFQLPYTKP